MSDSARDWRFVGFLGNANYKHCTYQLEGRQGDSVQTCYAPEAIVKLLQKQDGPPSRIAIVGTQEAKGAHWEKLASRLNDAQFVEIGKGQSAEEQWEIFNILHEEFAREKDRRLVVDITNGFRAQSFYAASVLAFCRAMDEIAEVKVYYAGDVQTDAPTPVWDITGFITVLDWTNALQLFLKTGRVGPAADLAEKTGRFLAGEWANTGKKGKRPSLDHLAGRLRAFGNDLATLRTVDLMVGRDGKKSSAQNLIEAIEAAKEDVQRFLPPLAQVLHRVERTAADLAVDGLTSPAGDVALGKLARTYLRMERYIEAATTLREAWITRFTPRGVSIPGKGIEVEVRKQAEETCRATLGQSFQNWIGQVRNDLDHAQMRKTAMPATTVVDKVESALEYYENWEKEEPPTQQRSSEPGPQVFLNISNHPQTTWAEEQKEAALQRLGGTGDIVDIPFPALDPDNLTLQYLDKCVQAVLKEIEKVPGTPTHAMVQGEHVLTTLLVARLQAKGITCLAATTMRDVVERADGVKESRFHFKGFREYPPLLVEESPTCGDP